MNPRLLLILLGLSATNTCFAEDPPPFVKALIKQYESASPSASPGSIWRYQYGRRTVYYVPMGRCCDFPSELYERNGQRICFPNGGLSGSGDGKCRDFFQQRTAGTRIWSDPRTVPANAAPVTVRP